MINLFKLVRYAKKSLEEPDLVFHEEAQTLMGLLRSKGVLPVNRTTVNGELHYLFSAVLVSAHYLDTSIYINSRMAGRYYDNDISTRYITFLDNAVTAGLLLSKSPKRLAAGEVKLSDALKSYLQVVENYGENLEQWNKDSLSALTI